MAKRRYTRELLQAQGKDRQIVVASCMTDPATRTGEVHVRYAPRYTTDAHPWVETYASGDGIMRYSGRECTVESRYTVDRLGDEHFLVRDAISGIDEKVFTGAGSYREATLHALYLNRDDRREAMGLPTSVEVAV